MKQQGPYLPSHNKCRTCWTNIGNSHDGVRYFCAVQQISRLPTQAAGRDVAWRACGWNGLQGPHELFGSESSDFGSHLTALASAGDDDGTMSRDLLSMVL